MGRDRKGDLSREVLREIYVRNSCTSRPITSQSEEEDQTIVYRDAKKNKKTSLPMRVN